MEDERPFLGKDHASAPVGAPDATAEELEQQVISLRQQFQEMDRDFALAHKSLTATPARILRSPIQDGVLYRFVQEFGRHPQDAGFVIVTSSDPDDRAVCRAANAADPSANTFFCSDDRPDQWIAYDFGSQTVTPVAYLIQTANFVEDSIHPRSWVLEGSLDGGSWIALDQRNDSAALNGPNLIGTFHIAAPMALKLLRLRQTGLNAAGNHILAFQYFDLFTQRPRLHFPLHITEPFNGVIAYLNELIGGNVAERGGIEVLGTPRSGEAADRPSNVASLDDYAGAFWSVDEPGQALTYDFKDRRVVVTHYALRSAAARRAHVPYLRSWVLEASADGGEWVAIDARENEKALNAPLAVAAFRVSGEKEARLVRIRQTAPNHAGAPAGAENALVVSAWEIFGELIG
jgi:hypothetical protein